MNEAPLPPSLHTRTLRLLHWVSAFAILLMVGSGFLAAERPQASQLFLHRIHVGIGLALILMTGARLLERATVPPPPPVPSSSLHRLGIRLVHGGLYLLLFALFGTGLALLTHGEVLPYLQGEDQEFAIPQDLRARQGHATFSVLFITLTVLHIGGVAIHQLRHGNVMSRMGPRPPQAPTGER